MPGRIAQAGDWEFIEPGTEKELTRSTKGIRIDQEGTADILPENVNEADARGTGNYLQGEQLNIQGLVKILDTTTARLQVFY